MMAHLQHNNIHVNLQLFQELNGKFPEVPEDVVKKFMQKVKYTQGFLGCDTFLVDYCDFTYLVDNGKYT